MKYRKLGKSSISVSEIGFGTWGIGGTYKDAIGYGPTEDKETLKALLYAKDHGVNFYDTAPLYGHGHSEEMLGKAFQHCRDKVIISTKVGIKNFTGGLDFSPKYIVDSLNQSLQRLRTDYVDALLLHSPPIEILKSSESIFQQLELLQKAGKVRLIGISGKTPSDCLEAINLYPFDLIQANFSLVDQRMLEIGLLDCCQDHQIGVVGRTPLCFGFLTGKYSRDTKFDSNDHRSRWGKKQIELWFNGFEEFKEIFMKKYTGTQLALKYCLTYPISTTIPGMINVNHVKENIYSVSDEYLEADALSKIDELYQNSFFFNSH